MDDENHNWALTYGDIMSLLLCFFVMLYAVSTVEQSKVESATESIRGSFGLFGQRTPETSSVPMTTKPAKPLLSRAGFNIPFPWGHDELTDEAKQTLDNFVSQCSIPFKEADTAASAQRITITVQTAADEKTQYRRSLDLTYSRSAAVWDYLVSQGIQRERMTVILEPSPAVSAVCVRIER
ncbi:MAG: OmpA family protein [Planctomycetaceae bacterium]|jgi:chemotaxis protein MotB|nr:OmpA family protein [Planctomycetaceae bacterium]